MSDQTASNIYLLANVTLYEPWKSTVVAPAVTEMNHFVLLCDLVCSQILFNHRLMCMLQRRMCVQFFALTYYIKRHRQSGCILEATGLKLTILQVHLFAGLLLMVLFLMYGSVPRSMLCFFFFLLTSSDYEVNVTN